MGHPRCLNDAADTRSLPCDASVLGSPLRKLREGRGTHGVDASESGSVPCCRSKISKGSQNPHPNVAKGATLGWGTRLFALLPKFGEGLFPVNRLHSAAFEIIVTAIQHFTDLGQFQEIPGHCVFNQVAGWTPALAGEFLKAGFGFRPKVYFHICQSRAADGRCQSLLSFLLSFRHASEANEEESVFLSF